MQTEDKSVEVTCPDCGAPVFLGGEPELGEMVTCPACWAYLKVVALQPLTLQWDTVDEPEENWDDE
jgi:lysine biosynthesis protein LysW